MNTSGVPVANAWRAYLRTLDPEMAKTARLVVLHDELESEFGKLKMKEGGSAKGHNGLKSCMNHLGAKGFVRVGIGIGRPESRESGAVSSYVLRKMTGWEKGQMRDAAGGLARVLEKIRTG